MLDPWYHTGSNQEGKLTYLSVALLGRCTDSCVFCYVGGNRSGEWQIEPLRQLTDEARALGMRKIQLSGGEPMLFTHLDALLVHLSSMNVNVLMATNGSRINQKMAEMLARHNVNVGLSLETLDSDLSDELSGRVGAHQRKLDAIANLKAAGYTRNIPLNIIVKTLKANYEGYLELWEWALEEGIQPILDRAIPSCHCELDDVITPEQLENLMKGIGELQGIEHTIPFTNNEGCNRLSSGLHVEVDGRVMSCAGLPLCLGQYPDEPLEAIWGRAYSKYKGFQTKLGGGCGVCRYKAQCGGCRGVAYALTGDPLGPDLLCYRGRSK